MSKLETVPSENLRTLCMACHEGHNGSAQMCHTPHCMLGNLKFERAYVFFLIGFEKQRLLVCFLVFLQVKDHIYWKKMKSK